MRKLPFIFLCFVVLALCATGCGKEFAHSNPNDPDNPIYGPPSAPSGLSASAGHASVSLSWTANTEADLSGYNIYRSTDSGTGFTKLNSSVVATNSYSDSGLTNGTAYYYKISAVDTASNESSCSTVTSATPTAAPDTTAPAIPTGLVGTKGSTSINLSWTANSESDIAGYNIYRDYSYWSDSACVKVNASLVTSTSYVDAPSPIAYTWIYKITAVDTSGNASGKSTLCTPTTDTTVPAAPAGLSATKGDSQVALSWTANTESDLAGYNIYYYYSGIYSYTKINTSLVTTNTTTITGRTNGTTYYFKITAVDTAGNEGTYSSIVSCVPGDSVAPAAPTGLTAIPYYYSIDQINLSWYISTESDLSHYHVYRSASSSGSYGLIGESSGITYSDSTGLSYPTTYYYKIIAVDTSGNESGYSNVASSKSRL